MIGQPLFSILLCFRPFEELHPTLILSIPLRLPISFSVYLSFSLLVQCPVWPHYKLPQLSGSKLAPLAVIYGVFFRKHRRRASIFCFVSYLNRSCGEPFLTSVLDLLTAVKKRKLRWYGHKTRSTGLAKMILQGTVQGGRRRGRQKKRWEDVTEWTGLKLGEALRKAENREEWRTVVARSSLVPQQAWVRHFVVD